jgi:hypothetical protein
MCVFQSVRPIEPYINRGFATVFVLFRTSRRRPRGRLDWQHPICVPVSRAHALGGAPGARWG